MTYPRASATPNEIAVGVVILIADGAIQTTGIVISIKRHNVALPAVPGAGTTTTTAAGTVIYEPTQSETALESFIVEASKADCYPVSVTVISTRSTVSGTSSLAATQTDFPAFADYWSAVEIGTAQAGAATTITLEADESATTDIYKDSVIFIRGGTGVGQYRQIIAYDGGSKIATVDEAWVVNPASGSTYLITGRIV